jgi:predicted hydrolase (HD superfamily)
MALNLDDALDLLREHNSNDSLVRHGIAVSDAMGAYARQFGEDETKWRVTGLLHDVEWLAERQYPDDVVQAVRAHNDYHGIARDTLLARTLFACDELTGLITAAALVRPNKSIIGLEASSVRKKMKDKAFARGVNRDDIIKGAEELGVDLNEHIAFVIVAMADDADRLKLTGTSV